MSRSQPQRGDIFVEPAMEKNLSSVRSGICRPDGAGELDGVGGYKDFAPDGAFGRSATVSAGPVAAGGRAEAVENILRRGFAGGRAQAPVAGLCDSRVPGKSGGERAAVQTLREVCECWAVATAFGVRWL